MVWFDFWWLFSRYICHSFTFSHCCHHCCYCVFYSMDRAGESARDCVWISLKYFQWNFRIVHAFGWWVHFDKNMKSRKKVWANLIMSVKQHEINDFFCTCERDDWPSIVHLDWFVQLWPVWILSRKLRFQNKLEMKTKQFRMKNFKYANRGYTNTPIFNDGFFLKQNCVWNNETDSKNEN